MKKTCFEAASKPASFVFSEGEGPCRTHGLPPAGSAEALPQASLPAPEMAAPEMAAPSASPPHPPGRARGPGSPVLPLPPLPLVRLSPQAVRAAAVAVRGSRQTYHYMKCEKAVSFM